MSVASKEADNGDATADLEKQVEFSVHLGWIVPPVVLFMIVMHQLSLLGPALLVLTCVPNLFGVHMLLSWQWALATVIAELAPVPSATPVLAAIGYCIVGCPYYALLANMILRMGVDLPTRVRHGWARWIILNLLNFGEESLRIVTEVLKRRSISVQFKIVFFQLDLLCHLLPMLYSLQKHAFEVTPSTCGLMAVLFFSWAALVHMRHFECKRLYSAVTTGRLYFTQAPHSPLLDHMQRIYLTEPSLTVEERNLAVTAGLSAAGVLVYLAAAAQQHIIEQWLALGSILPLDLLRTIYGTMIVTVSLSLAVAWYNIFFAETRDSEQTRKTK